MGYTPHVLVVGGGPLGAGLARDFAIRGLDVTLATPGPLVTPRLGGTGALLASGAQFARADPAYAKRCLAENRTLFEIADHCVEDTGGLLVADDLDGVQAACEDCSITARRYTGAQLREREPGLGAGVAAALAVPDAAIDPSLLTVATARDASEYGADIRPRTRVTDIRVESGVVDGVSLRSEPPGCADDPVTGASDADGDPRTASLALVDDDGGDDTAKEIEPSTDQVDVDYVVNAAGADAGRVVALADCSVPTRERTVRVVSDGRPVETAVTRPADGPPAASVVPVGGRTLLADGRAAGGEGVIPEPRAVDALQASLAPTVPDVGRALRAYREPRFDAGEGRDFAVLDHDTQGCWGLLTVFGGTVTTHRFVAERVCDRVCTEFGIRRACQTDDLVLPGSENVPDLARAVGTFGLAEDVYEHSKRRLGSRASTVLHADGENPVLCPDRSVTRAEVRAALDDETAAEADLGGLRVRTAAVTGACQGGRCGTALAAELHPEYEVAVVERARSALLAERWRGQRPVTGPQQTEMARTYRQHAGENRGREHDLGHEDIAAFDGGFAEPADRPTCCPRVGWER